MKKLFTLLFTSLMIIGCGGGSGGSSSNDESASQPSNIEMVLSAPYTVYPGDQIVKTSENAKVTISHIDGHSESTVILIDGNATIIRH